jgi:hypothetical protein
LGTPLYRLKTSSDRVALATHLAYGFRLS